MVYLVPGTKVDKVSEGRRIEAPLSKLFSEFQVSERGRKGVQRPVEFSPEGERGEGGREV